MKFQHLLIGAVCGMSAPTFAQTNVTPYGIVDTGVEFVTHANAAGDHLVRIPSITGSMPSRWGIRGSEDLGGGLSTVFTLESGFNMDSGTLNQGGRLFGRQAFVGLNNSYGLLSFGRQYNMMFWAILDADLLGPDIYGGVGSFDAYIPNARSDNTLAYKGKFSNVTVGTTYSFGRDAAGTGNSPGQGTCAGEVAGDLHACRDWSAMLRYDTSAFGVAAAYDEQRGGTNAAANFFNGVVPLALSSGASKDIRMQLNGYFKTEKMKIGGGWLGRHLETAVAAQPDVRSNLFYLSASYLLAPTFMVDGGVYRIINKEQDTRGTITALRGSYFLSKRTTLYVQTAYLANSGKARYVLSQGGPGATPASGAGQFGAMAGVRHVF